MKKLRINRKGVSPAVAAIVLLTVTIIVSLAVAIWMGAISFQYMKTEELQIQRMHFIGSAGAPDNSITLIVKNIGTEEVTLTDAYIKPSDITVDFTDVPVAGGDSVTITLNNVGWKAGLRYDVTIYSSKGNQWKYTETAP